MSGTTVNTEVKQVETTLAAILGAPTGENVITPPNKNNLFSNNKGAATTITDIEKAAKEKADKEKADADAKIVAEAKVKSEAAAAAKAEADKKELEGKSAEEAAEILKKRKEAEAADKEKSLVAQLTAEQEKIAEEELKKTGNRPGITKDALISGIEKRIKDKSFLELEGVDKPLAEYTAEELWEVVDLNLEHKQKEVAEQVPVEFFEALPPEFQTAFTYLENLRGAKGSYTPQDVQHILKVVTQAVNIMNLDITTEEGQEEVVRNYLAVTNYGTPEEIDEEVSAIKDRKELEKKSGQFKPKLDAIQQKNIENNLKATEQNRKKAEKQAANWMDTVYKALEPAEIGGMKLTKKDQTELYNSLVQVSYPSFTGQQTNEFGYLLENKQFGKEQDLEAVFLARMILKDKEGTLNKIREQGGSVKAAEVAKKLKIEQANKGTAAGEEDELGGANRTPKKLVRKTNNIFK